MFGYILTKRPFIQTSDEIQGVFTTLEPILTLFHINYIESKIWYQKNKSKTRIWKRHINQFETYKTFGEFLEHFDRQTQRENTNVYKCPINEFFTYQSKTDFANMKKELKQTAKDLGYNTEE